MVEKIALSAAMVHNELVADLHPDFFVEYKELAKHVKRLYYENKKITPNMVALKSGQSLDDIVVYYPTKEEGAEAILDLKVQFEKRSFTEAIQELARMNERHGVETCMKIFADRIASINNVTDRKIYTAEEVSVMLLDRMSEARKNGPWYPLFGMPHIDELIKGYSEGDVIMLLAGPKEGKSAAATRMIQWAAENGHGLFLSSGEMVETDALTRPVAAMSGHKSTEIDNGSVISDPLFLGALDKFAGKKIFISNRGLSIPYMQEEVVTYSSLHGVKLFLYDQLNLFDEADDGWGQKVVKAARQLANQHKVAIVIFHQINKDGLQRPAFRPSVYSARGGQAPLMQSTKIILLHRPEHHGLTEFMDGPFRGLRSHGLMEVFVGYANKLRFGSGLVKFIGEQQAIDFPDEYMNIGNKRINLREAIYHGSAPEVSEDSPIFAFDNTKDDLPF